MRQILTSLLTILLVTPALAEDPKAPKVRLIICDDVHKVISICTRSCTTWAQAQPDFQYSFDVCFAKCPKEKACDRERL
jgi:hypothetical protein